MGIPHDSLVEVLSAQGWPKKEIYNALADHYRWLTGVDIPRRSGAGASTREADRAIELLESKNGTFFDTGSTALNANGRELLTMLAQQLSGVPNKISIEGHTDSQPYANDSGYGNWELSTDRANAARRLMQDTGIRHNQVSQVRGYADQRLRLPNNPLDPSNRRISLIVQYLDAPPPAHPVSQRSTSQRSSRLDQHPLCPRPPRKPTAKRREPPWAGSGAGMPYARFASARATDNQLDRQHHLVAIFGKLIPLEPVKEQTGGHAANFIHRLSHNR